MELYPIFTEQRWEPQYYIIIEAMTVPSICPEFEPGPPEDFPFPEFWDTSLKVVKVDIHENKCEELSVKEMRELYGKVKGRSERIGYWRVLKYREWEAAKD